MAGLIIPVWLLGRSLLGEKSDGALSVQPHPSRSGQGAIAFPIDALSYRDKGFSLTLLPRLGSTTLPLRD